MGWMSRGMHWLGVLVLVCGLGSAAWLYLDAGTRAGGLNDIDADSGLEGGLHPEDFKSYSHDMEAFGGKIWVMLAAVRRQVTGLGQGRPLAVLVGVFSLLAGLALLRAARPLPRPNVSPDATARADRDIPGPPAGDA